jgi:hypothetical protein
MAKIEQYQARGLPETSLFLFCDDDLYVRKLFSRSVAKATWKIKKLPTGRQHFELVDMAFCFMDQYIMASTGNNYLGQHACVGR